MGMSHILVQNTSRDQKNFPGFWGDSLLVLFVSILISLVTVYPIAITLLPSAPYTLILAILAAEFLGLKLCNLAGSAFIANGQVKRSAESGIIYTVLKFLSVLILPFIPSNHRLLAWGWLYFISSVVAGLFLALLVNRTIEKPLFRKSALSLTNLKQGFYFSVYESAASINGEIDLAILTSLDSPVAAGIYGGGTKFNSLGFLPIAAVAGATYARFFKHGETGIKGSLRLARKLLPAAIIYGILAIVVLFLFAPFAPVILGDTFAQSQYVIMWLAPVHLLTGLNLLAADTLTAAGFQKSRTFVQVSAAILNVGLNSYMIPLYSWQGAIWATLISETFSVATLWILVLHQYRKAT
jgi:O-antigen/teichoic acid export membrane protein